MSTPRDRNKDIGQGTPSISKQRSYRTDSDGMSVQDICEDIRLYADVSIFLRPVDQHHKENVGIEGYGRPKSKPRLSVVCPPSKGSYKVDNHKG